MTYTADDFRKAADLIERIYPDFDLTVADLRVRADRMEAAFRKDGQVDELASLIVSVARTTAYAILTDGRWKRVEDA
ncbi:hypothetical protein I5H56_gp050 [Mycobacterium phage KristaRAM]|uniref:Uncharacterized protein n=3 Tax=Cheoctovirus TaxID=1623281 RepID=A0A385DZJ1_9CAUD|nr:hypothetical protein AVT13_gp048 [Mycobacterium phage Bipolar]YP_009608228.1 hypothetical protein FDI16_gp046 [Mycobacterium phage Shauna1]YP_009959003.1 hypothetical protein I5H56_gp050 [Mycobacterium phage KristaRAM]YP_009962821.1 hypothetical protein I5H93_gp051 [Mycobacterium phage SuperGrey]QGH77869.1 hypothetical protein SEA_KENUHA5_49 [Mycobacterium phage Kenuha5]WKW86436.1 hypothetical protein SEA_SHROOMBOI_51 [Mycobacterium phage ShroomBoi]AEJ93021.1 hypothetical protein SHAUNA1_4